MRKDSDFFMYLNASQEYVNGEIIIKSPYAAVLQEARNFTGRDYCSGLKREEESHVSWLGAVGYMIAIDHIGDKFYLLDSKKEVLIKEYKKKFNGLLNSFTKALIYFSDLSIEEIAALYSLRCTFAHDFFLENKNKKIQILNHHFSVTQGTSGSLVRLGKRWDGREKKNNKNKTIINLELFGDLVEDIYNKLLTFLGDNKLMIYDDKELDFLQYKKPKK